MPVTTPVEDIDALPVLLLHVPPGAASVRVTVELTQTAVGPLIVPALGNGFTVTIFVATAVPQTLVTV
jgi:hypothetical protein